MLVLLLTDYCEEIGVESCSAIAFLSVFCGKIQIRENDNNYIKVYCCLNIMSDEQADTRIYVTYMGHTHIRRNKQ